MLVFHEERDGEYCITAYYGFDCLSFWVRGQLEGTVELLPDRGDDFPLAEFMTHWLRIAPCVIIGAPSGDWTLSYQGAAGHCSVDYKWTKEVLGADPRDVEIAALRARIQVAEACMLAARYSEDVDEDVASARRADWYRFAKKAREYAERYPDANVEVCK